jgi:hypothetical protein
MTGNEMSLNSTDTDVDITHPAALKLLRKAQKKQQKVREKEKRRAEKQRVKDEAREAENEQAREAAIRSLALSFHLDGDADSLAKFHRSLESDLRLTARATHVRGAGRKIVPGIDPDSLAHLLEKASMRHGEIANYYEWVVANSKPTIPATVTDLTAKPPTVFGAASISNQ